MEFLFLVNCFKIGESSLLNFYKQFSECLIRPDLDNLSEILVNSTKESNSSVSNGF